MMFCFIKFSGLIRAILDATTPEVEELTLGVVAYEPIEALVHQFGCIEYHGAYCETLSSDVVGGDQGVFVLWMAHFF
jgi:hypothetical protein